jgi:hypothetical protein
MAYTHLVHRAQALACFLAPVLFVVAFLLFWLHLGPSGLLAGSAVFNETSNNPAHFHFLMYEALILMIPAVFALTHLVGQTLPRLAATCAILAVFGLAAPIASHYLVLNVATAVQGGFPMNWDFFVGDSFSSSEPVGTEQLMEGVCLRNGKIVRCGAPAPKAILLFAGLPILLYFLVHVLLGAGVLRTGALPRWSGVLLIAAGLLHFDSTGPQPSNLPLLTGLLSGLCLLVVYSMVGLRFWRG